MATITIEVPDEVAEQLNQHRHLLTELLLNSLRQPPVAMEVYRHILEFIANCPTPEQIAAFELMPEISERLRTLLARERTDEITLLEKTELGEYERIEHLVVILKAGNLPYMTE